MAAATLEHFHCRHAAVQSISLESNMRYTQPLSNQGRNTSFHYHGGVNRHYRM